MEAAKNHLWGNDWKGERTGILETHMRLYQLFQRNSKFKPYRTKLVTQNIIQLIWKLFQRN